MPRAKKTNAFNVQLDSSRIRVVLMRRQAGGPLYARFWVKNRQYLKCTDRHEDEGAREEARKLVEECAAEDRETLSIEKAIADCLLDRWPRLEAKARAEEKKEEWGGELSDDDKRKHSHWSVSRLQLAKFREFCGKDTNIRSLSFESATQLVQQFIDARTEKDASPQTIIDEQRIVSRFFAWLIKKRKETRISWVANPAFKQFLEVPKVNRVPKKPVSQDQLKTLIEKAKATDVWPAVLLCLQTGLRPIGTTRIRWSDVDFDTGKITVTEKNRTRNVPLSKWVLSELAAWRLSHAGEYLVNCHKNTLHDTVKRIRERNKLAPEVTLQGCRRTFISMCLDKGLASELVASIAGNSVAVIEKHYKDLRTLNAEHVPEAISLEGMLGTDDRIKNRITEAG